MRSSSLGSRPSSFAAADGNNAVEWGVGAADAWSAAGQSGVAAFGGWCGARPRTRGRAAKDSSGRRGATPGERCRQPAELATELMLPADGERAPAGAPLEEVRFWGTASRIGSSCEGGDSWVWSCSPVESSQIRCSAMRARIASCWTAAADSDRPRLHASACDIFNDATEYAWSTSSANALRPDAACRRPSWITSWAASAAMPSCISVPKKR